MPVIDSGMLPAQSFEWGVITWLVAPSHTPGAGMSFGEVQLLPGQGHGRHNHPGSEEILYVLSGEGEQTVGDDDAPFPVRAGDTIYVPTGVFHATLNTGRGVLRLLAIYNPAGPERDLEALPDFRAIPAGSAQGWERQ